MKGIKIITPLLLALVLSGCKFGGRTSGSSTSESSSSMSETSSEESSSENLSSEETSSSEESSSEESSSEEISSSEEESSSSSEQKELIFGDASITVNGTCESGTAWTMTTDDFTYEEINITDVISKGVYGTGEQSARFAAARGTGSLTLTFDAKVITYVKLYAIPYSSSSTGSTDSTSITVATSANAEGQTLELGSSGELEFDGFEGDTEESTTLTISSYARNRFYLTGIDLVVSVDEAIYPTAVTLSGDVDTLAPNKSTQLKVSYSPNNTNQKYISFESSDESVATVSETGLVTGVGDGTTKIIVKALKENGGYATGTYSITVDSSAIDKWTILIYMCGSDLESGSGLATSDLKEIASVSGQPDDINIVIEAGGASSWESTYSSVINKGKLNRFHLEDKKYVIDEQITRASMGASSTLQSFLEWGLTEYPAEKTALIFWNHGGGMNGACYDEIYSDDCLLDNEVVTAVKGAYATTGITKLEWVGYDCCLMQTQEVAEFNSPYFNYMIASEESEAGYGWDYDTWVDDLFNYAETETILTKICDGFIEDNGGVNATGEYYYDDYYAADQHLSYLNLNNMEDYFTAWEAMAEQLKTKITSTNKSTFRKNVIGKTKYFAGSDYSYFGSYDAYHFLSILENNSTFNPGSAYIDAVRTAFTALVGYNLAQQEAAHDANGLSFYFHSSSDYSNMATSTYSNFTNWNYICANYGGSVSSSYSY